MRHSLRNLPSFLRQVNVLSKEEVCSFLCATFPHIADPLQASNSLHLFLMLHRSHPCFWYLTCPTIFSQIIHCFGYTPGLSNAFFRYPSWITEIFPITKEEVKDFRKRILLLRQSVIKKEIGELRRFKTKEFIRIAFSEYLRLDIFEETTAKISLIADCCINDAMQISGLNNDPIAVIAMGKWGGMELNYSSDIDLLFVAGDTVNTEQLPMLQRKAADTVRVLDCVTEDGFVFRVDNRLRPEGRTGALVKTAKQYFHYYQKYAHSWELQALIKARFAGVNAAVGNRFTLKTKHLIYNYPISSEMLLRQVRDMKAKIEQSLISSNRSNANVKLGIGGIRDIEFIVQFLQLHHGKTNLSLRHHNTLTAIKRLLTHGIITGAQRRILQDEYIFLRQLEHCLQIGYQLPIRQLPKDAEALHILGKKMQWSGIGDSESILSAYERSVRKTRNIFYSLFDITIHFLEKKEILHSLCLGIPAEYIEQHIHRLESDYILRFPAEEIAEHISMIYQLSSSRLCRVIAQEHGTNSWKVTIVAYDYRGEFAMICGLFSAYNLNIIRGESFTYNELEKDNKKKPAFYRLERQKRRASVDQHNQTLSLIHRRKIVCVAEVKQGNNFSQACLDWNAFRHELEECLFLLHNKNFQEASERNILKAVRGLQLQKKGEKQSFRALPPLEYTIDNDSDEQYTILDIQSEDRFMFLFEFSNALATRNYYIYKVEIITEKGIVRDHLFILTGEGRKITSKGQLRDLTITITVMKQFSSFLRYAPNPQMALQQFGSLLNEVLQAKKKGIIPLIEQPDMMKQLAQILGTSIFLWEDFLRMQSQHLLPLLVDAKKLNQRPTLSSLYRRLRHHIVTYPSIAKQIDYLNLFKDREMFRIDLRHLTGRVVHFSDFCAELTFLADVIMKEAFQLAIASVQAKVGLEQQPGIAALCALGKWGGKEIGYASDIELMLLWDSSPDYYQESYSFYERVAQALFRIIRAKHDGIFELDFQLRPGGKNALLATSFARYKKYYSSTGEADIYERQALIRLRTIAGDPGLKKLITMHRREYVFSQNPINMERIWELRCRQEKELVRKGECNAKFSQGGLVEAEYFIQILQLFHGYKQEEIRGTNTIDTAKTLQNNGIISREHYDLFYQGYSFLRALINGLRIVRGNAKDLVIPGENTREFSYLIRRLEYLGHSPSNNPMKYITEQMTNIHALFLHLFPNKS